MSALASICAVSLLLAQAPAPADPEAYEPGDPAVGFLLASWADRPTSDWEAAVQSLYDIGVNDVSLLTYRFNEYDDLTGTYGTNISTTSSHGHARPDDSAIQAAVQAAAALGMTVTINPFVEVDAAGGIGSVWRGSMNFSDPDDLAAWFVNYESYMCEMGQLAETYGADRLFIGSELQGISLDGDATPYWESMIASVRSVYGGELSYAANYNWEYDHVPFWDDLDTIGIDAYFELASEAEASGLGNPSVQTLEDAWESILSGVQSYGSGQGLPVVFSEVGYTYWDGTTAHPWHWQTSTDEDYQEQLNAYQAVIHATDLQGSWLDEMTFWHWSMPGGEDSHYAITADSLPGTYIGGYVPEPASLVLMTSGLCVLAAACRKRVRKG